MRLTVLSGGVGGARFTRGLLAALAERGEPADVTVVANTGDDLWLHGVRVCPDLDTLMYTLGGAVHEEQGWGRRDETSRVSADLAAYGVGWDWFTLGDLDLATHLARTQWLREGLPLSAVTGRLAARWGLAAQGVTLLPMSDQPVETHVDVGGPEPIHFEEWWVRHRAALPARGFTQVGLASAVAAPGVLEALRDADVVLLPPSNPVVSVGTILAVPGVREALTPTSAPVVGVSPNVGGAPVPHDQPCVRRRVQRAQRRREVREARGAGGAPEGRVDDVQRDDLVVVGARRLDRGQQRRVVRQPQVAAEPADRHHAAR